MEGHWRIVPDPGARFELVQKEHLIGHFQVQSTYERLKRDYFWKKMREQIVHVISQ